jgi:Permuted papain-like amidase enzyme, YaeF/YiiX, C92 family
MLPASDANENGQIASARDTNPVFSLCDIIAVRGKGWLSDNIIKAEYDKPTYDMVSHVGICINASPPIVIEALNTVKTNPLFVTMANAAAVYQLHPKALTDAQREIIINTAVSFSNKSYGYLDLALQLFDAATHTNIWTRKFAWWLSRYPICSFVVAASYGAAGLNFGVDTRSARPSDIMTFALANPNLYEVKELV